MSSHPLDNGGPPADPQPHNPSAPPKGTATATRPAAESMRPAIAGGPGAPPLVGLSSHGSATSPPASSGATAWVWVVFVCILAGLGVGGWYWWQGHQAAAKAAAAQPAARPIPVVAVPATMSNFNVYLTALGNVSPYNTVTVRSRVDGQLMEVHFTEGQSVQAGDLLFHIDSRPFEVQRDQAEGQLARDQASLKNAQLDLQRYELAREAITGQQIDTATAAVAQFQGAIKTDQATLESANLQIAYCDIKAPITGRIGLRLVDKGNMVHASDAGGLAVITQVQPIAVLFSLRQDDLPAVLPKLQAGQKLPVEVTDRTGTKKLAEGTLETVDNTIDPTTGTARFKATFANRDLSLFPSQFVNVRMLVNTLKEAVSVPAAAVQRGPNDNSYVYVVQPDESVEMRQITPGLTQEETTVIDHGLKAGEMVVTDGVDKLRDGTKVIVRGAAGVAEPAGTQPQSGGRGGRGGGSGGRGGGAGSGRGMGAGSGASREGT